MENTNQDNSLDQDNSSDQKWIEVPIGPYAAKYADDKTLPKSFAGCLIKSVTFETTETITVEEQKNIIRCDNPNISEEELNKMNLQDMQMPWDFKISGESLRLARELHKK